MEAFNYRYRTEATRYQDTGIAVPLARMYAPSMLTRGKQMDRQALLDRPPHTHPLRVSRTHTDISSFARNHSCPAVHRTYQVAPEQFRRRDDPTHCEAGASESENREHGTMAPLVRIYSTSSQSIKSTSK